MRRPPHTLATQDRRLAVRERLAPPRVGLSDLTDAELVELEAHVIALETQPQ